MNLVNIFWRFTDLLPALHVSVILMPEMPLYFKLKFLEEKLKETSKDCHSNIESSQFMSK